MRKNLCLALLVCLSLICACGVAESNDIGNFADVSATIHIAPDDPIKEMFTLVVDAHAEALFAGKEVATVSAGFTPEGYDEQVNFDLIFDFASPDETLYRDWGFVYDRNFQQFTSDGIVDEFYGELDRLDQILGMLDVGDLENPTFPVGTLSDDVTGSISIVPVAYYILPDENEEPIADLLLWDCEVEEGVPYQDLLYFFLRCPQEDGSVWCLNCADYDLTDNVLQFMRRAMNEAEE